MGSGTFVTSEQHFGGYWSVVPAFVVCVVLLAFVAPWWTYPLAGLSAVAASVWVQIRWREQKGIRKFRARFGPLQKDLP